MASIPYSKAFVIGRNQDGSSELVKKEIISPVPWPNEVKVKVTRVAQNPTDVGGFDSHLPTECTVPGCDFAGTVVGLGSGDQRYSIGDEIAGVVMGGERHVGAFEEYTLADKNISFKIPPGISPEEAATVPLASLTALLALFSTECLNINRASTDETWVLIWGGSSSVGLYAIQLAALYGIKVVTTCSPQHFELVKSLGATHAFDYKADGVVDSIKDVVPNLEYFFDTVGTQSSTTLGAQALSSDKASMCTVRPNKAFTDGLDTNIKVTAVLMWTAMVDKKFYYRKFSWRPVPGDQTLGREFMKNMPQYLTDGRIKPNVPKLLPGTLDGVREGFQMHRDKKISGYKIVYDMEGKF